MNTLHVLLALAGAFAIALGIALDIKRRRRRRMARVVLASDEAVETKQPGGRPIKEFRKQDFQFLDQAPSDPLFIYSRLSIINPVTAKIVVQNGGALLFYGMTTEDIVVNAGGSAVLYGTVVGNVTNNGGELHVYGRIIGTLTGNAGQTEIYGTAQVLQEPALV